MRELSLEPVLVSDAMKETLRSARLLVDDLDGPDRSYFALLDDDRRILGYSGIEFCGDDAVLLRSVVVVPEHRGQGFGRPLVELTIAKASRAMDVYLATTDAAPFFESIGFARIERESAPPAILSTRQLSGLCPASATIMKLNRPPT
ncbi:arsenic resistance N-acetyltransferase ArsN2 [Sinorhizobium sp. B11]|uniref:arsenic resistance N-acetyltransferase ArsN2 n=1 Tax=Rhizobium bangladeshense TaxID=1138189 RepID=UPI001C82BBC0|nr:arsenic resistance N-acetyltransferase ArsN2 [Rhizobium bangladeshense]MBX4900100.1 GNAT family N-acetyltransferase [Rhizobium bangladeshense]MBX4912301.1 GNAT family N-acetyltransferase [Rhizobium bangladeshense]